MQGALNRMMAPMADRIKLMVGRAVIAAVDDGAKAQALQIELLADEVQDGVERFQDYGFTSVPHAGAEALVVFVGGTRSHGVAVAIEDRRYRLTGLEGGEVALYDDQGQVIRIGRDGITIDSPFKVTVTAPQVIVESDAISLGGEGGAAVARVGDTVAGGLITSGSDKVSAS